MEYLPKNRILEFNPNQLESVRKQYNLEKPGDMSRAVDVLEEWVKVQKHFMKKELPRNYLEKTILAAKGSLERAKRRIDKICTFRTVMPDFFGENLINNNFMDTNAFRNILLPKPTNENYRVHIIKGIGTKFVDKDITDCMRFMTIMCEYIMAYDYCDGLIIILDHREVNMLELARTMSLTQLYQIFTIMIEGFGMRIKGIHEVTSSKTASAFVSMMKHVLSPKVASRICLHNDISTLDQYVPKEIMPADYGGKEKCFDELYDVIRDEFTGNFRKYLEEMNEAKTDESLRESGVFNEQYLGVPGSFRMLNVD